MLDVRVELDRDIACAKRTGDTERPKLCQKMGRQPRGLSAHRENDALLIWL